MLFLPLFGFCLQSKGGNGGLGLEAGEHHPARLLLVFSPVLFSASQLSVNVSLSQSLGLLSLADSSSGLAQPEEAVTADLGWGLNELAVAGLWAGRRGQRVKLDVDRQARCSEGRLGPAVPCGLNGLL